MFKINSRKPRTKAQSMVEFALALPILLLIVFGMLEVGRLIFIYGSVVTASREAVRYGSATGVNNSGTPRYMDCAGIVSAGRLVGFLSTINISIRFESPSYNGCPPSSAVIDAINNPNAIIKPRLVVEATSTFTPVAPLIPGGTLNISAVSRRTILGTIYIKSK